VDEPDALGDSARGDVESSRRAHEHYGREPRRNATGPKQRRTPPRQAESPARRAEGEPAHDPVLSHRDALTDGSFHHAARYQDPKGKRLPLSAGVKRALALMLRMRTVPV